MGASTTWSLPALLAERVRLLVRVAELDGAHHTAAGAADLLRGGIARASGITEHEPAWTAVGEVTSAAAEPSTLR
jgi:hypothetical protein